MASFSNSRATNVQSPTLLCKINEKKVFCNRLKLFQCENRLNLSVSDRPENFISFFIYHFLTFCAVDF